MSNTVRVKLEYTRKVTKTEKGYVEVDVPSTATIPDVYRAAYEKKFKSYLPRSYEVHNEDWDFVMKERPKNGRTKEPA